MGRPHKQSDKWSKLRSIMKITTISDEQIYALEQAISSAVQERIDTDLDVADCYLR